MICFTAGVFCAIVSHPADTIVSKLNQDKGSTAIDAAKKLGMAGVYRLLFITIDNDTFLSLNRFICGWDESYSVRVFRILHYNCDYYRCY